MNHVKIIGGNMMYVCAAPVLLLITHDCFGGYNYRLDGTSVEVSSSSVLLDRLLLHLHFLNALKVIVAGLSSCRVFLMFACSEIRK